MEHIGSLFYEEGSIGVFALVTIVLGGAGAWLTGSAIAATWRPLAQVVVYSLVLGIAVRFIHFALFGGTLLSLHYYVIDAAICMALGVAGYRVTRARQMVEQYHWLNRRDGIVGWRRMMP